ncbi:MAG: hypothetical protein ACRDS0_07700 [Pseudonocardiaceae bacterium]
MDAPTQDVASLRAGGCPEPPWDAEIVALGLDDDYLHGAKVVAGALLALALVATLTTSLLQASNVAWTVLLAVVTAGFIVVMRTQGVRRRGDRRLPTDP